MKKSLVLAMAMALGVTASAYAANPFSDVPAGHWAYDSISKLAAAGIIEGYGDDTFRGDRLMTRYEMAQIVAKALAKGANVDRLAAEFADELDALGVRVAALEKKADNVKITGQVRYNYTTWNQSSKLNKNGTKKFSTHRLRSRLYFNGKVNDNWNYQGMIQNIQNFKDNAENNDSHFRLANINGRLGGMKVTAGRYFEYRGDGNIYDDAFDGIRVDYGNKVRLNAYFGKPTQDWTHIEGDKGDYVKYDRAWGVGLDTDLGKKVTLSLGYDYFKDPSTYDTGKHKRVKGADDDGIFSVGLNAKLASKVGLNAMYFKSDADLKYNYKVAADDDGFVVGLNIAGANYNKPGTWGLSGKYYDLGAGIAIAHTMNADCSVFTCNNDGFKGYLIGGYYTLAKGMRAGVEWYDLKGKESDKHQRTLWTELQVRF